MGNLKNKYLISVIIPTYNRSDLLNYSLISLTKQKLSKTEFEVIVADDGSTDNTRELVRQYEDKLNLKYVYQEDKGYRPGSARNKGIRAAEGEVCLLIDSGVILDIYCLEQHRLYYEEMGLGVAAIGYVYGFDQTIESEATLKQLFIPDDPAETIMRLSRDPIFFDVRDQHYFIHRDQIHELPAPWFYFWTCHVSAPRQAFLQAGLFDEIYDGRWGVEDNDMGFRLCREGIQIRLLRSAESIHYPHSKDKPNRLEQGYMNCLIFHDKFPTLETQLFLQHYTKNEFIDINTMSMEMQREKVV